MPAKKILREMVKREIMKILKDRGHIYQKNLVQEIKNKLKCSESLVILAIKELTLEGKLRWRKVRKEKNYLKILYI